MTTINQTRSQSQFPGDSSCYRSMANSECFNALKNQHHGLTNQLTGQPAPDTGALMSNVISLFHRKRLPLNSNKLPLVSLSDTTRFVSFKIELNKNSNCKTRSILNQRALITMRCYTSEHSMIPKFEIPLYETGMISRTCTEAGPSLYLTTEDKVHRFQCQSTGYYNYHFWEVQLTLLGVKLVMPHDIFVPTSTNPIGEGSFAQVYTAINRITGVPIVIKRMPKNKNSALPQSYESAVQLEISILQRISHPNVVKFEVAYENEWYYYIVLEKLKGGTVNDWLRQNKKMTEDQAREAIFRVLSVLSLFQEKKIVHRDLKLENLVLKNAGDPTSLKIIDFGLAAYLDTPRMNMFCGSPGFVAPEIINKQAYGSRVDMFSTGALLYAFFSGKAPFHSEGKSPSEILFKNKMCKISFESSVWKTVSQAAKDFILQLLEKNPQKRLSADEALNHPWIVGEPLKFTRLSFTAKGAQSYCSHIHSGYKETPRSYKLDYQSKGNETPEKTQKSDKLSKDKTSKLSEKAQQNDMSSASLKNVNQVHSNGMTNINSYYLIPQKHFVVQQKNMSIHDELSQSVALYFQREMNEQLYNANLVFLKANKLLASNTHQLKCN